MDNIRRCWLEIDLNKLEHNLIQFKNIVPKNTNIIAVLKADACNHGSTALARKLISLGISFFAVACLEEAIELRTIDNNISILILGYTEIINANLLKKYNLIQTIIDYDYALALNQCNYAINCHLKIDTGMHRIGVDANRIAIIKEIYNLDNLNITGIYSHLSVSDSNLVNNIEYTQNQIYAFDKLLSTLRNSNINYGVTHLQSTYGIINYPNLEYDYVRLGTGLYGFKSDVKDYMKINLELIPILQFKCLITSIKYLEKNDYVGYGNTYQALTPRKIAILNVGFGDGYKRSLSNKSSVYIHGKKANVIGKICMDQMMVDITNIDEAKVNDVVTLIGDKINIESLAATCNMMTNEFLVNINKRVEKVYIQKKF